MSTEHILPIKKALQAELHSKIEMQIASYSKAIASIEESKLSETKSSAGDKYETGRAMMQMEQDKLTAQLVSLELIKTKINQISPKQKCDQGMLGAIVITDTGSYYLSVSLGKITIAAGKYYTISPEAPLSILLMGKKVGDRVVFRNRQIEVIGVL